MSAETIRLRDRYEIRFDEPLPGLAPAGTAAYGARDLKSPNLPLMALVPDERLPPRVAVATAIRTIRHPALWTALEWGVIDCPPRKRRAWVVVGDFPDGGRFIPEIDGNFPPWDEGDVKSKLLQPLLPALRALTTEGIAHRAIRLDNIWYRDQQRRVVMLGDCVTAPPAARQPLVYEPIESALAQASGRGEGRSACDFYTLGVLILHFLGGELPCAGLSEQSILDSKIRTGSLTTLTAKLRLTPSLTELCRGLLADNPVDRWGIQELNAWMDGRRLPFKPPVVEAIATRPFIIGSVECLNARSLARALADEGDHAVEPLRDRGFQSWLNRALPAPKTSELVAKALADGNEGDPGGRGSRLVARVGIALDPSGPIRYRGVAALPDGLASVLCDAALSPTGGPGVKALTEIILARLVQFWIACQTEQRPEYDVWSRDYDRLRMLLVDPRPGFGVERAIYELNPRLHCLSPAIEASHVMAIDELLPALEQAVERNQIASNPIDRHVAGFIASRSKYLTESLATQMGRTEPTDRVLGALTLLARLQNDHGPTRMRALSSLLRGQVNAIIGRIHSRSMRRRLHHNATEAASSGRLATLLETIDNPEDKLRDVQNFKRAVGQCNEALREIKRCIHELDSLPEQGAETAHTMAALIASVGGVCIIAFAALAAWSA